MIKLNFQPKQATKSVLIFLDKKPKDIIEQRFGLKPSGEAPKTLEAIGQGYGITRERVRQIEEDSLRRLKKSEGFLGLADIFGDLKEKIETYGGVVHEERFLDSVAGESLARHHVRFLLVLGDDFEHLKEDDEFYHRWTTNSSRAEQIQNALKRIHGELSTNDLLSEKEIFARFIEYAKSGVSSADAEILSNLLNISRLIDMNALGEWGHILSPAIRPRGVRDLAFLAMRKHGSPMHFKETAETIGKIFSRSVNTQTVHNELIKDERFVLVGRGLYALKEWGYESGVVRDVIRKVISAYGPLAKNEIIKTVMKERYVKENTVLINLQNGKYFKKNSDGAYVALD